MISHRCASLCLVVSVCQAAIRGPVESTGAIRLSGMSGDNPVRSRGQNPGGAGIVRKTPDIESPPPPGERENRYHQVEDDVTTRTLSKRQMVTADEPPAQLNDRAKLKVLEPPAKSIVVGPSFLVSIEIEPENMEDFSSVYEAEGAGGKVCVSLDDELFYCWPALGGRILFSEALEGSHTLVAMLYKDGELREESSSGVVTFRTLNDPKVGESDLPKSASRDDNRQEKNATDEQVDVSYPVVEMVSPKHGVTYPGTSIILQTVVEPSNLELFQKHFQYAFSCVSVDIATAYSCFAIYGDKSPPVILGLESGIHIIEAALSHPENGGILFDSKSRGTFYTAGASNQDAFVSINVTVDGYVREIPMMRDGDLLAQTNEFCASINMDEKAMCQDSIHERLSHAYKLAEVALSQG